MVLFTVEVNKTQHLRSNGNILSFHSAFFLSFFDVNATQWLIQCNDTHSLMQCNGVVCVLWSRELNSVLTASCSSLVLQLPIKVGHQNTHTKVSTEHNKECLINISKYKFSLVISGLTNILKNVNNMVSGLPPLLFEQKPVLNGSSSSYR